MSSSPSSSSSSAAPAPSRPELTPERAAFRDIPIVVEVLLGRGSIPLGQLMRLERGAVIRIDSAAGADLLMRATGVPLAMGEVVIIEDSVAARVSHMLNASGEVVA
jgi:flagellar motor switch protein FliN/FliY